MLSAYTGPYGGLTNIKIEDDDNVIDVSEKRIRAGSEPSSDEENRIITTDRGRSAVKNKAV